ncbi:MAG: hypothetical protein RR506_09930 [Akkermansia sp.]
MNIEIERIIVEAIFSKIKTKYQCPMCHINKGSFIADGIIANSLQNPEHKNSFQLGGTTMPAISLVCSNCGFISQHAIGVLFESVDDFYSKVQSLLANPLTTTDRTK